MFSALQAESLPAETQGKPKNTGVGSLSLLKWIFPTQELNWSLPHCRQILYQLSYQGSPGYEHSNCQFDFSCSCRTLGPSFSSHLLLLVSCPAPAIWWRQQLCQPLRDGPGPCPCSLCPLSACSPHAWRLKYLSLSESHRENLGPEERSKTPWGSVGSGVGGLRIQIQGRVGGS